MLRGSMRLGALTLLAVPWLGCGWPTPPPPPPDVPVTTTAPLCLGGPDSTPLLAWARGNQVLGASAAGTVKPAYAFAGSAQVDTLSAVDGFLLSSAVEQGTRSAVLLDASGAVRWAQSLGDVPAPVLGAGGWTTVPAPHAFALSPDGARHDLQGQALGPAGAGGWVPTLLAPLGVVALERPLDGTAVALDATPAGAPVDLRWLGDRVLFVGRGDPTAVLAIARPEGDVQVPLGSGFETARIVSTTGHWALMESGAGTRFERVDLETQRIDEVASVFPDGWMPLAPVGGAEAVTLDADGALLRGFDGPDGSALLRSDDLGHTWERVGEAVALGEGERALFAQHLGAAWVVSAYDVDLGITTLVRAQLVLPSHVEALDAAAIGFGAPLRTPSLDPSGECAVYWKPQGATAAQASNAELRVRGTNGADVSLSLEAVPLTSWTPAVWR